MASKAPFDKKYTKGPKSEGNKPVRAHDVHPQNTAKTVPTTRMSSLKAAVMRSLGQK